MMVVVIIAVGVVMMAIIAVIGAAVVPCVVIGGTVVWPGMINRAVIGRVIVVHIAIAAAVGLAVGIGVCRHNAAREHEAKSAKEGEKGQLEHHSSKRSD